MGQPRARQAANTLCPEGRHQIRAAPNAADGLRALERGVRERLVDMLCDVAEVAALAPTEVDFRRLPGPFAVRAGPSIVLYSVDEAGVVTLHHVVEAEALPRIA